MPWRHRLLTIPLLLALTSNLTALDKNERDEGVLFCSADSDLYDLLARAGQLDLNKKHLESIELQKNLLSIRPNCYDVHLSLAMTYAVLGREAEQKEHYARFEELKRQYQSRKPVAEAAPVPSTKPAGPVLQKAPPKKDKINYWKWLYIYSVLKKK